MRFDVEIGPSTHGIWTRYTDRLAAALLDANRMVTRTVPERCTGFFSSGVTYISRF
jgi:hypothetical protein